MGQSKIEKAPHTNGYEGFNFINVTHVLVTYVLRIQLFNFYSYN